MKIENNLKGFLVFCSFFGLKPCRANSLKEFKKFIKNMKN
jgi:hypothetical protein